MVRQRRQAGSKSGDTTADNHNHPMDHHHDDDEVELMAARPDNQMEPLLVEGKRDVPLGDESERATLIINNNNNINNNNIMGAVVPTAWEAWCAKTFASNPEFYMQAGKFLLCFAGLQASYLTWGYMQELIMTHTFTPTARVPSGKFPSAAFCVFSNRFLAVLVAMIAVKIKHGSVFGNNKAPLLAFTPCAISNTMSSWSQYASLKFVSFPVQTVFKSSKIIPVMFMGKVLKGTTYKWAQYAEAILITLGVAIFSMASKDSKKSAHTELIGLVYLLLYVTFDSFTSQWQDSVYQRYGKAHVDQYQMMLGVNCSAIIITTVGMVVSGDLPVVFEFLHDNPLALRYNIITAITSASGQLCIFYTIKEFGPIVFTIIMTTRQMISICISAMVFGHKLSSLAVLGAALVFAVLFYQIRSQHQKRKQRGGSSSAKPSSG